ncbi:MAG: NAD(P)H-hydrate dehydratase [Actinobacteria bacterium]|nr:NAD(P)H-hydrate dehydratase [Actinomycetota bacterium]
MDHWKRWSAIDARPIIAIPSPDDDKYSRGVLGVIAGSPEYPGAAILTTSAALQTGLGLLRYIGPPEVNGLVLASNPEIVLGAGRVGAWIIGPGISAENISLLQARDIEAAMSEGYAICLDAGALTYVDKVSSPTIITPHYRELEALFIRKGIATTYEEIRTKPKYWATLAASKFGVTVLLKGNVSVVASMENQIELPASTPWLATAGTGDVLAGIIGTLMATNSESIVNQRIDLTSIAATGSFIHQRAAEFAILKGPIKATDVIDNISRAITDILT